MNLEKIWAEYRTSLKAFLHSKVSNAADVDDLLQELLIKTHQNLNQIRDKESIKSWLFQIANHGIIDFYRRNGKYSVLTQIELSENELGFDETSAEIKGELSHCIAPFIQALDQQSSELLTAIDLNNESQKTYAQNQGISYSTLKSRVQKARSELRALFDGCCKMTLDAQGNLMDYDRQNNNCDKC
jgi:RNA polymerase sigma-70 factor, ECF subfamily